MQIFWESNYLNALSRRKLAWMPDELSSTFLVGKFGLASLRWGKIMTEPKRTGPIKLSGRALYNDGQMINSNVINHVTKERLG